MPTTITIRSVPDETRNELAARAARSGRSLQEYLRSLLIELTERPDVDELLDRIVARKRATDARLDVDTILAHKAADRQ